jgi:hypothetical protein
MTGDTDHDSIAEGVHDAFLTVLTTGSGFGPDYPWSREDLLAAVTEGVRQAFAEVLTAEQTRRLQAVDQPAAGSRRYNRLDDDQLAEVLDLWTARGSAAVAQRFCVSRRQADRYIKKARERNP